MPGTDEITAHYISFNPTAAGEVLEKFSAEERNSFLKSLDPDTQALFVPHLSNYTALTFLKSLDSNACFEIFKRMDRQLSSAYLSRLEKTKSRDIVAMFPEDQRTGLQSRLSFLPNTAGQYMDSSVPPLHLDLTVEKALEQIRQKVRIQYYIYLVDDANRLKGVMTLRKLIQEKDSQVRIGDLMDADVVSIYVDKECHEILEQEYLTRFHTLPVIDFNSRYLGILRHDAMRNMRDSYSSEDDSKKSEVSDSLSELYSIGFSSLLGSVSTLIPKEDNL